MCFTRHRIPKHLLLEPTYPAPRTSRRLLKWIFGSLALVLAFVITDLARADESPNTARAGTLLFKQAAGFAPAVHLASEVQVNIKGMLASVVLRQTFKNSGNGWEEGVYVFPLPEDAAVNRMVMEIGERRIVASIREKQEAQRIYQQAKTDGRRAALISQERPNLFTQSIANIAPGEEITVELHYKEVVDYRNETFTWRIPTTLTPRYIPGVVKQDQGTQVALETSSGWGWALPTDQVEDAHRITPWMVSNQDNTPVINPLSIHITLEAGMPLAQIHGSYHELSVHKDTFQKGAAQKNPIQKNPIQKNAAQKIEVHKITTLQKTIPMDRDFEITWQTLAGQAPDAAFFREQVGGDDYALLMLLPPQQTTQTQTLPRDVVFIIDTSGSMAGTSIQQAKASLLMALERLQPQDRFNVIEFNTYHQALFPHSRTLDDGALEEARRFVKRLQAEGGTEMLPALAEALRHPASEGYLKQVIFMTDGSVGNEAALFELIHQQLGDARLFTLGIGSAPNSFFMTKAAELGRGTFTLIGDQSQVASRMQTLFTKLESPVMSDIEIHWPGNLQPEVWPERIPDLYSGEPLLVSVKFTGELPAQSQVIVTGQQAGQSWSRTLAVSKLQQANSESPQAHTGIAVRWAREKISSVLDQRIRGRAEAEVRADVLAIALEHQLVSPYTSFVAVEETPARPQTEPLTETAVPNLMPQGQTQPVLGYPRTATTAPFHLLLGILAGLGLMILRWARCHGAGMPHQGIRRE